MRSSILDHHCPLLHHWASHCCWKKIHSTFTWIEALWGTHFSVTVLFSLVNIQNLFHTLPSSFLCRGSFAFHFTKIVHSDLDSVISISLYYMTFLDSLNVFWVIFFRCGIFWFPTLTLPLVCAPPPPPTGSSFLPSRELTLFFLHACLCFLQPSVHTNADETLQNPFPFLPAENLGKLHIRSVFSKEVREPLRSTLGFCSPFFPPVFSLIVRNATTSCTTRKTVIWTTLWYI